MNQLTTLLVASPDSTSHSLRPLAETAVEWVLDVAAGRAPVPSPRDMGGPITLLLARPLACLLNGLRKQDPALVQQATATNFLGINDVEQSFTRDEAVQTVVRHLLIDQGAQQCGYRNGLLQKVYFEGADSENLSAAQLLNRVIAPDLSTLILDREDVGNFNNLTWRDLFEIVDCRDEQELNADLIADLQILPAGSPGGLPRVVVDTLSPC